MVDRSLQRTLPDTVLFLGYAGLIPFVALPFLQYFGLVEMTQLQPTINAYAFGIISFICGTWWRADMATVAQTPALILSNCVFLIGFFAFVLLPNVWPLIAAVLLLILFTIEHYTSLIGRFSMSYKFMRGTLSVLASIAMLCSYIFYAS
ncbi:DUF3429 domain-containing protein [Neptunomonas antarctica]|uniref:DUF3429 domain-containing protein n=1 Tax=Neptunomonas antarctica TaxID=619304 RepID=A0A1N7NUL9_9GAMM|nr:DUF3429 domain-containing protein [Neptunomonas antarctica]SIT02063.1 Protein of unknown function [Neptunomonas antarctica]